MVRYMSIPEAALLWRIRPDALRCICEENQISGAVRFGYRWLIPSGTRCPSVPASCFRQSGEEASA